MKQFLLVKRFEKGQRTLKTFRPFTKTHHAKKLLKKLLEKNNNLLTFRYGTFSHCLVHIVQNFYQYYQYFDQTIGFNEIIHVLNSFFRQLTQDFRIRSYLFSLKIISVSTQIQYVFFLRFRLRISLFRQPANKNFSGIFTMKPSVKIELSASQIFENIPSISSRII